MLRSAASIGQPELPQSLVWWKIVWMGQRARLGVEEEKEWDRGREWMEKEGLGWERWRFTVGVNKRKQRVKPAQVWIRAPTPRLALFTWQILRCSMVFLQPQLLPWLVPPHSWWLLLSWLEAGRKSCSWEAEVEIPHPQKSSP